jgi:type IV pilus assembly protein PilQ
MLNWRVRIHPAALIALCVVVLWHPITAGAEDGVSYKISNIESTLADNSLVYTITGQSDPVYTVSERFAPFRVVLDIAGGSLAEGVDQERTKIPANSFVELAISHPADVTPPIMRFEFKLADSHDYSVEKIGKKLQMTFSPTVAKNQQPSGENQHRTLSDFKISSTPNSTTISILANGPIDHYTVDTIGAGVNRPPRMYIDIDDVDVNELVREKTVGTSVDKVRVATRTNGARIVFDSAKPELFAYTVVPTASGLDVVIDEAPAVMAQTATATPGQSAGTGATSDATLDKLIDSTEQMMKEPASGTKAKDKIKSVEQDFSFSGYNKQRISVDFYKIDIHNVFRLFRQITDLNIIVDEGVQGSLTLALNDVPWDFALDIILNLMNLKKEERFNTIVIYPAKKDFVWPTRAEDNLDIKADVEVIEQEALQVEKTENLPPEVTEAKSLIDRAQQMEKSEKFEEAAELYVKAQDLWPDNIKITNRIASLYLVRLGLNAKALFYAKKSLQIDGNNTSAALYAAIASANMQNVPEAQEYFTRAISGTPPMKEALLSYAAFAENNDQNDSAVKLIDKYHESYGESVQTMVAKARLFDKLGKKDEANKEYRRLLNSGFSLRPDLKHYIEGRLQI